MTRSRLEALLTDIVTKNDGDFGLAFRVVVFGGTAARAVDGLCVNNPLITSLIDAYEGVLMGNWTPTLASLPPSNRWHAEDEQTGAPRIVEQLWRPFGVTSSLGCLVTINGRMWGWIGTFRLGDRPAFTSEDAARGRPAARRVVAEVASWEPEGPTPPPGRVLFIDAGRTAADEGGHAGLRQPDALQDLERLRARLGPPVSGVVRFGWAGSTAYEATALTGDGNGAWLIELAGNERLVVTPLAALSPLQREVAEMAAAGATIDEIARSLGRSENTIKTHLRRVYEATGVATRAELLELVRASVPEQVLREGGIAAPR